MNQLTRDQQAAALEKDWAENPRWKGIKRGYSAADVVRLRGSIAVEHTLARRGAEKLWTLLNTEPFVNTLGALTGNQAMQQVKAGLKAIYLSGWQVAADANDNGEMYPDQSLYSVDSVPKVVKRINGAFTRADQIQWSEGKNDIDFFAPIVADAEAGFGGVLNAFELMKAMIDAGAAGVHFEDQLASVKKCGHMGGKVLVPTREAVAKLVAARLAADVMGVPTMVIARTDADAADLPQGNKDIKLVRGMNVIYTSIASTATPLLPFGGAAAWTCGDRVFAWKIYAPDANTANPLFEEALARFSCNQ